MVLPVILLMCVEVNVKLLMVTYGNLDDYSLNRLFCAMVNGSNSASKYTIEVPHDESVSIGCSAQFNMGRYANWLKQAVCKIVT